MREFRFQTRSVGVQWLVVGLIVFFVSCTGKTEVPQSALQAAAIESGETCHLCGMVISDFSGPKGELALKDDREIRKFCSTRDLFGFYLQPENKHRATAIYVHDMSKSPWASPSDDHFINAEQAWFVYGSEATAAMGPALASFGDEEGALAFVTEFGGQVYRFEDLTLALLNVPMSMSSMNMHGADHSEMPMPMSTEDDEHSAATHMNH